MKKMWKIYSLGSVWRPKLPNILSSVLVYLTDHNPMAHFFFFLIFICSEFCHTLKWKGLGITCLPHPSPLNKLLVFLSMTARDIGNTSLHLRIKKKKKKRESMMTYLMSHIKKQLLYSEFRFLLPHLSYKSLQMQNFVFSQEK